MQPDTAPDHTARERRPVRLSRRWLDGPPPIGGPHRIITALLTQQTITTWTAFTYHDVLAALQALVYYTATDYIYDEVDDDTPAPNRGNPWHEVLHSYALTGALHQMAGLCPPEEPFY